MVARVVPGGLGVDTDGNVMTTVTVIISTYNYAAVLPFSVASALRQTHEPLEVLVVGDACTDASDEVVAAIGDPRVRFVNLAQRVGSQAGPNNEGIRQARGEVIAYLGHDDLWFPQHVERVVGLLQSAPGVVADRALFIERDGRRSVYPRSHPGSVPVGPTMAHRRDWLLEHDLWWRTPDVSGLPADEDFYRQARHIVEPTSPAPRLGVIKLTSTRRPGVYRDRPTHEQELWLGRLAEPDIEAELALSAILGEEFGAPLDFANRLPARTLLGGVGRILLGQARWHLDQRFGPSGAQRARGRLDVIGAPLATDPPADAAR